jgi:hypothetical protein
MANQITYFNKTNQPHYSDTVRYYEGNGTPRERIVIAAYDWQFVTIDEETDKVETWVLNKYSTNLVIEPDELNHLSLKDAINWIQLP